MELSSYEELKDTFHHQQRGVTFAERLSFTVVVGLQGFEGETESFSERDFTQVWKRFVQGCSEFCSRFFCLLQDLQSLVEREITLGLPMKQMTAEGLTFAWPAGVSLALAA
ncbi:MAG: hypothetical protein AAF585_08440 [Verrucomicrobiota bacterium]